jgi:hypothetical protein
MNTRSGSFLNRVMRAITRGAVPNDASQCDGPCVVHAPADAMKAQRDGATDRQSPIRWLSLR